MIYKKILVAVDGSEISKQALHEAIGLAKDQKAKLRIVHVVDEYFVDYSGIGIDYDKYEASMKKYGLKILKEMEEIARQSNTEFESKLIELKTNQGRIEQKIIEEAKNWPADLIVIGTHGRRGLSHLFLGSVAEGVVRIAPMPVLLIRGKK
jgi:nucleotide-binding universal stress UspA family protein